ncbi:MAG TPA: hypothetical protein VLL76_10150 [Candidatus Omnitrophota bacterium]|nr:hypothetical protein [Candidatus Omnitrophota bacterium]
MVKALNMRAAEVADALGVCETASSRKIEAAEELLETILRAPTKWSRRPDLARSAVAARLRTLTAIVATHPEALEPWLEAVQGGK